MTYNLYADVFFLVNFIMNFLVLLLTGKVLKIQTTVFRLVLGSAMGALWAVIAVIWPVLPKFVEFLVTYVGISSLMVKISFHTKDVKDTGKAVIGLYLTTASVAGLMYALYQHTKVGYYIEQWGNGNGKEAMPLYIFGLLAAGGFFGAKFLWLTIGEEKRRKSHIFNVQLHYQGKSLRVTGLMDTGNHLYEPVTHKPVHILTYEMCRQLCEHVTAVIYVPYQSVGTTGGVLPAIYLDSMELEQQGVLVKIDKPLVAIYKAQLSPLKEYQMLLHEEI